MALDALDPKSWMFSVGRAIRQFGDFKLFLKEPKNSSHNGHSTMTVVEGMPFNYEDYIIIFNWKYP